MTHDKSFEKTHRYALKKWSIQKFTLDPFEGFKKYISKIQKASLIEMNAEQTRLRDPKI